MIAQTLSTPGLDVERRLHHVLIFVHFEHEFTGID